MRVPELLGVTCVAVQASADTSAGGASECGRRETDDAFSGAGNVAVNTDFAGGVVRPQDANVVFESTEVGPTFGASAKIAARWVC